MSRARLISPEFWTSEAVVDCTPMTRLLLLGLSNFADDFGALPLRPRTIRLQVFPGDALDDEQVRAMIEELAARGLVRRYTVDEVDYLSLVDWEIHQRVGRRARRRYPASPSAAAAEAAPAAPPEAPDHSKPQQSRAPAIRAEKHDAPAAGEAADAAWHAAVEGTLRRAWGADVPADLALHAARWRAQGRDLARDVLPALAREARAAIELNRRLRLDLVDGAMPAPPAPFAMAQTIANHSNSAAA